MRATYGVCLHNFFWRQCCPAWLAPGLTGPPLLFAFDDCSCGMLKSERIWFSGMHEPIPFIFLSKTFIYMVDSAPKDQGRSVTHLLEPYDSYLCEKIDFYIFGGGPNFFFRSCVKTEKYFWVAPILESV
jgi:hypothetical protein